MLIVKGFGILGSCFRLKTGLKWGEKGWFGGVIEALVLHAEGLLLDVEVLLLHLGAKENPLFERKEGFISLKLIFLKNFLN